MELYHLMQQFADVWGLVVLFTVFMVVVVWAFRPGARKVHADVANSIFRNEKKPAPVRRLTEEA